MKPYLTFSILAVALLITAISLFFKFASLPNTLDGTWAHTYLRVIIVVAICTAAFLLNDCKKKKLSKKVSNFFLKLFSRKKRAVHCPNCGQRCDKTFQILFQGETKSRDGVCVCEDCFNNPEMISEDTVYDSLTKCQWKEHEKALVTKAIRELKHGVSSIKYCAIQELV